MCRGTVGVWGWVGNEERLKRIEGLGFVEDEGCGFRDEGSRLKIRAF